MLIIFKKLKNTVFWMELSNIVAEVETFMKSERLPLWEIHINVNRDDSHAIRVLTMHRRLKEYAKKERLKFDAENWYTGHRIPSVLIQKEGYDLYLCAYEVKRR